MEGLYQQAVIIYTDLVWDKKWFIKFAFLFTLCIPNCQKIFCRS